MRILPVYIHKKFQLDQKKIVEALGFLVGRGAISNFLHFLVPKPQFWIDSNQTWVEGVGIGPAHLDREPLLWASWLRSNGENFEKKT